MSGEAAKVLGIGDAAVHAQRLRAEGKVIVQAHGCFDLLHIGHIRHLQAARRLGDALFVTVTPDEHIAKGPARPLFDQGRRAEALAALACVEAVAISPGATAADAIRLLRPQVYVKGQEHEVAATRPERLRRELEALEEVGGVFRVTQEEVHSSTAIIERLRAGRST